MLGSMDDGDYDEVDIIDGADIFSPEGLKASFTHDFWKDGTLLLHGFQLTLEQYAELECAPFRCLTLESGSMPTSFVLNSQAFQLALQRGAHLIQSQSAGGVRTNPLYLFHADFKTSAQVDDFLLTYAATSRDLKVFYSKISVNAWRHLWESPLFNDSACRSLSFTRVSVASCPGSVRLIPPSWLIHWSLVGSDDCQVAMTFNEGQRILTVSRICPPSLSDGDMAYFQADESSLLHQDPPSTTTRQSILLEALHRANLSQAFELCQTYLPMLLLDRTKEEVLHDVETSVLELRSLGTDHQGRLDQLFAANREQVVQSFEDNDYLHTKLRSLEDSNRSLTA
jgi:hypothetical protein